MKRILLPALGAISLGACLGDDPVSSERVPCDPLLTQVTGVTGDTVSSTTGLQYITRQPGSGATASAGRVAEIHYTLSLTGNRVVESSCIRQAPFQYTVGGGGVIAGFDEGVRGMRVGGVRRVIVPPSLGYGEVAGHELQNETLVFDIELVDLR